jgi:hypothetical protein
MSLAKAVPEGIRDKECKRFALQEHPPVSYILEKGPVQETVSALKSDQSLKTTIGEDAELRLLIWHCGTCEAFSHADEYNPRRNQEMGHLHGLQGSSRGLCRATQGGEASLWMATTSEGKKVSKKASAKKSPEKASQKTKENAALPNTPAPELRDEYQAVYDRANFAKETAKIKREAAATNMFQSYTNLLSLDAKYMWNKIVKEQTEADLFKDLQGMSRKGPMGLSRESFDDCIMFHLLTVFPINAAKQEKYYLSNVLKKPQRVGVCQFVQRLEQLNAYVMQLPCWYYSPSYNADMTPVNILFTEADLASHVLQMCPHQWQDQYNLQEKGMTPMYMRSLQASLKAIERVCTPKKPMRNLARKLLRRTRQEPSGPVLEPQSRLTRKSVLRGPASCARNMGARLLCTPPKIAAGTRKTGW